jgi:endonuclease/exonuclease/phosphatase family metal-dependent hydrolase
MSDMKIYSWNILRENQSLEDAYEFIEKLDFDVLCLQEITNEMLERFKTMPFHMAYGIDKRLHPIRPFSGNSSEKTKKNKKKTNKDEIENNYLVILSRHPLMNSVEISIPDVPHPLISHVFEHVMAILGLWRSVSDPHAIYADIHLDSCADGKAQNIRIFCIHLTLWTPETRRQQFESIVQQTSAGDIPADGEAVFCGDFNILEKWPVTVLNFLLGGKLSQMMPWYWERNPFEKRFEALDLQNPLRGKITHAFSRSQLDHILIPKKWSVKKAEVLADAHGSDHQPVFVEANPL